MDQARKPTNIGSSTDGTTQNDVLFSIPARDTVYKAGLKIHPGRA
jgi:hemoglobin/transferrin/lactoferrin receptor protein